MRRLSEQSAGRESDTVPRFEFFQRPVFSGRERPALRVDLVQPRPDHFRQGVRIRPAPGHRQLVRGPVRHVIPHERGKRGFLIGFRPDHPVRASLLQRRVANRTVIGSQPPCQGNQSGTALPMHPGQIGTVGLCRGRGRSRIGNQGQFELV